MILLIDNYDSFTYNLYHFLGELGAKVEVYRNDKIALEQIERPNWEEKCIYAEALRVRAWIHRLAGDLEAAEAGFRASLAVSRRQQAKSWELRAVLSYAELLKDQDRRKKALELLEPVYLWFTEGFDTRDLREARAMLEELR